MVHTLFSTDTTGLLNQTGGSFYVGRVFQRGSGFGYYGRQQGTGMGDVFRSVWRYLVPLAKSAGESIGAEGLETGKRIIENLAQGANLKETVLSEGKEGIAKLLHKAGSKLQRGSGIAYKRQRKHRTKVILHPEDLIGQTVSTTKANKKRQRSDTFGFY